MLPLQIQLVPDSTSVDAIQEAAQVGLNLTLFDPVGFGELMLRFLIMMVFTGSSSTTCTTAVPPA